MASRPEPDRTDSFEGSATRIPLPRAPADAPSSLTWLRGGEFTLGAEDELMLVDANGLLLGMAAKGVVAELVDRMPGPGAVTKEIFVDQVELVTPVCASGEQLAASLGEQRRWLRRHDVRAMAVGVHPQAAFGTAPLTRSARYDPIAAEFAGLLRTPTAAFQVHVALRDEERAIQAYRFLRNRLAVLRALGAGSPFWHGVDSGLASARSAIIRSYPRVATPPPLRSWDHYLRVMQGIVDADDLPDYTYAWWDLRPQPRLGTLEVRVMDAQPSLTLMAGLSALVQGLARRAVEVPDADDLPQHFATANDLRACRHGLATHIVDVDGMKRPLREVALQAVRDARVTLAPDGLDGPLDALEASILGTGEAQRQRRLCEQAGMPALLADLTARTMDEHT